MFLSSAVAPRNKLGMTTPMLVARWRAAFACTYLAAALSDSSVNVGNGTHDEAPRKRRYRADAAFITSVIWRTACALHSAFADDDAGVVLAMRSVV